MSMAALAATGSVSAEILWAFLALTPVVVLGFIASRAVNRVLDRDRLRTVSITVSAVGAALLIGQQIFF